MIVQLQQWTLMQQQMKALGLMWPQKDVILLKLHELYPQCWMTMHCVEGRPHMIVVYVHRKLESL